MEQELRDENRKMYEEYKHRKEEKRRKRENLELEIKNHQINLINKKVL